MRERDKRKRKRKISFLFWGLIYPRGGVERRGGHLRRNGDLLLGDGTDCVVFKFRSLELPIDMIDVDLSD
jgi:hypothetical protein